MRVRCPNCGGKLSLWDVYTQGTFSSPIRCDHCEAKVEIRNRWIMLILNVVMVILVVQGAGWLTGLMPGLDGAIRILVHISFVAVVIGLYMWLYPAFMRFRAYDT